SSGPGCWPQRNDSSTRFRWARAEPRPCLGELPPFLEKVAAPVSGPGHVPDRARQRFLPWPPNEAIDINQILRQLACPIGFRRLMVAMWLLHPTAFAVSRCNLLKDWRTRHDSNVRPLPSEGSALSS